LIVTGANSKRQPELATFWEKAAGQVFYMPQVSRLRFAEASDRLALAYNTIFSELDVPRPADKRMTFRFLVTPKSNAIDAQLNLQLALKPGETLETGAGKKIALGREQVQLSPEELGGWIRHRGWRLRLDPAARLTWPVFPFNPYGNAAVTSLEAAVGVISAPVTARRPPGGLYGSGTQEIPFALEID
jgi:hypothetical protein